MSAAGGLAAGMEATRLVLEAKQARSAAAGEKQLIAFVVSNEKYADYHAEFDSGTTTLERSSRGSWTKWVRLPNKTIVRQGHPRQILAPEAVMEACEAKCDAAAAASLAEAIAATKATISVPPPEGALRRFVGVPDELYKSFHGDFDRGAPFVMTGAKDGVGHKWRRLPSKMVVSFDDGEKILVPMSLHAAKDIRPLTAYAAAALAGGSCTWIYGVPEHLVDPETKEVRMNIVGFRDQNGVEHYNAGRPHNTDSCDACGVAATAEAPLRACAACRTYNYCSAKCQRDHWHAHKPLCLAIRGLPVPPRAPAAGGALPPSAELPASGEGSAAPQPAIES
jgi:hypothetical protein